MIRILNLHRRDQNIGDLMSAPSLYFDFPGFEVTRIDVTDAKDSDVNRQHLILGGGGLLTDYFLPAIERMVRHRSRGRLIAWGIGQQMHLGPYWRDFRKFCYSDYLEGFDLTGIRDYDLGYAWVPCASCMHSTFDKQRTPTSEFVIFSHKSRPVPIRGWPKLQNDHADFDELIDFLGSGESVITSSYHGMYWALLLGRRVIALPFNSKFFTLKHPIEIYPAIWKKATPFERSVRALFGKTTTAYYCKSIEGWRISAAGAKAFPEALEECRAQNIAFYRRVLSIL